jgi:hypothetical protein
MTLPKAKTIKTPIIQANIIRPLSILIPPFRRAKTTLQTAQVKENGYPRSYLIAVRDSRIHTVKKVYTLFNLYTAVDEKIRPNWKVNVSLLCPAFLCLS